MLHGETVAVLRAGFSGRYSTRREDAMLQRIVIAVAVWMLWIVFNIGFTK
jgi:hypothetical protein